MNTNITDINLDLRDYYRKDLEKIMMAFRLSGSIRSGLKNINSGGSEIETAVRNFYNEKLQSKYHVSSGHIIDQFKQKSGQLDIIISEQEKNPIFYKLEDQAEIIYYETVYAFGEIKRTYYDSSIIKSFSKKIKHIKEAMQRESIPPNAFLSSDVKIRLSVNLTSLPLRNPLLSFLFVVDSNGLKMSSLKSDLATIEPKFLPNFIVFGDLGIILNINPNKFQNGIIEINLYPEYQNGIWVLLKWDNGEDILAYQFMLLVEHLNKTLLGTPNLISYGGKTFDFSINNFENL